MLNSSAEIEIQQFTFNTIDYVVFVFMLGISAAIGAYFGFIDKGADTTDEYLMGGRRMKTIPIAISLVASQLSAISIMTIPVEIYSFGINFAYTFLVMFIVVPILCYVVIPVFYNNKILNCYEYLELRFNGTVRQMLTIIFMVTIFAMLPVFIFIPSLAFAQVSNINIHLINTIVCAICVFYTMFGGIKAVVWTDVVQAAIMVGSVALVGILGVLKVGGWSSIMEKSFKGDRLTTDFAFDMKSRATFWNTSIGGILMWLSYVGFNQSCVQRIVALPSLDKAKTSLVIFGIGFIIIMGFNGLTGLIMYARYEDCDPFVAGYINKIDKMVPYFVQDMAGHIKGMPGIFISCVFSAALSTMSASMNSLSGVVYMDYIKPRIRHTESRANFIMKLFIFGCGVYCVIGGFLVNLFTSILQLVFSIGGITFGSIFGVFSIGMLIPRVHGRPIIYAMLFSVLTMLVIVVGASGHIKYTPLPRSTEHCPIILNNATSSILASVGEFNQPISTGGFNIFELSFNWYCTLGAVIVYVIAIPLSYIMKPGKDEKFDPKLLSPIVQRFVKYELTKTEDELTDLKHKNELIN